MCFKGSRNAMKCTLTCGCVSPRRWVSLMFCNLLVPESSVSQGVLQHTGVWAKCRCYHWSFLAEIHLNSLRSPRKLFISTIYKNIFWIKVSKKRFYLILKKTSLVVTCAMFLTRRACWNLTQPKDCTWYIGTCIRDICQDHDSQNISQVAPI